MKCRLQCFFGVVLWGHQPRGPTHGADRIGSFIELKALCPHLSGEFYEWFYGVVNPVAPFMGRVSLVALWGHQPRSPIHGASFMGSFMGSFWVVFGLGSRLDSFVGTVVSFYILYCNNNSYYIINN